MDGCSPDDPNRLNTPEDLIELLRSVGFLPLFSNGIRGFSVEEHVPASNWWTGEYSDPWTWRHVLSSHPDIAYSKFFGRKAGFIYKDWFPVFANYRRNGYDFDALCDDELAPYKWRNAMEQFFLDENMVGKVLPASDIPEEAVKADLQMRTYLITISFTQKRSKNGKPYGMHCGQLATPETKWGYDFVTSQYSVSCEECWEKIRGHVLDLYPSADKKELQSLLGMRVLTHTPTPAPAPRPEKSKTKKPPFPDNLIMELCDIPLPITNDQLAGLRYAISTLKPREQQAVIMRYEEGQTFKAIGDAFGVSSGRAQQITAKGVRKLHHPSRLTYIKSGFEKTKQKQEEIRLAGTSSECSVAYMGFSTRVTNALLANGLDTIAKVCYSIENAQSIPGLGLASYEELLSVLKKNGVKFENPDFMLLCEGKGLRILKTGWGALTMDSSLECLDMSYRLFHWLSFSHVKTVGQLLSLTGNDHLRNIGVKSWEEIRMVQCEAKAQLEKNE